MATLYQAVHDECGFIGTATASNARAERALRDHSCASVKRRARSGRRRLPAAEAACGLSIELPPGVAAPASGDWVVTRAGSRYLVIDCRTVQPATPGPLLRYRLGCTRLEWNCPVPPGVRAIERGRPQR